MKQYYIVVRDNIHMPWIPSDYNLQVLNCWFRSPVVSLDESYEIFDVLDELVERFQILDRFRYPTVEVVCVIKGKKGNAEAFPFYVVCADQTTVTFNAVSSPTKDTEPSPRLIRRRLVLRIFL